MPKGGPATVPPLPRKHRGDPRSTEQLSGAVGDKGPRRGLHPDLSVPALSSSPCAGVTGRCGKLGDKPLTAFPQGVVDSSGCRGGVPRHEGLLSGAGALAGVCGREREPGHAASHPQHRRDQGGRGAAHPAGAAEGRGARGKLRCVPLGGKQTALWATSPTASSGLGDSSLSP